MFRSSHVRAIPLLGNHLPNAFHRKEEVSLALSYWVSPDLPRHLEVFEIQLHNPRELKLIYRMFHFLSENPVVSFLVRSE
jgi:hypothetical protein